MSVSDSFQDLILALQQYWAEQGCVVLQPYDMEMGAGTFHVATFLRSIGPEPWNAAYVQPSRRPTDGRYGENPNRLQHYYQYQVALKPSPLNIQDLYLDGKKDEAARAVPTELADEISLVGSVDRIKDRLQAWKDSPVTSLMVSTRSADELRTFAELVLG